MAKYRKLQQEMEGAVERADMAENTLGQLRARNRSASVAPESTTTFGLTVGLRNELVLPHDARITSRANTNADHRTPIPLVRFVVDLLCIFKLCLSCWAAFCQLKINEYCIVLLYGRSVSIAVAPCLSVTTSQALFDSNGRIHGSCCMACSRLVDCDRIVQQKVEIRTWHDSLVPRSVSWLPARRNLPGS